MLYLSCSTTAKDQRHVAKLHEVSEATDDLNLPGRLRYRVFRHYWDLFDRCAAALCL